ncbi:MAG TPA: amidohydrolase family protein, partial [Vicinamibacterales bacterium]
MSVVDAGRATPHQTIVVRGGRIAAIDDAAHAETADVTIDGAGLFAIPGLIDAHVHLSGRPRDAAVADLKRALQGGVTSVFDLAGDDRETGELARESLAHEIEAPTIVYVGLLAGPAFFTDSRVVAASLGFTPGDAPWAQAVTDESDPVRTIAAARGTGAAGIKLYAAIDATTARRMTEEAHRAHLSVVAHAATFPAKPSELVNAGVDMLAHAAYLVWEGSAPSADFTARARGDFAHVPVDGPAMTALIDLMAARHTALNPTLWIFAEGMPKDALSDARTAWMNAITARAARRGV